MNYVAPQMNTRAFTCPHCDTLAEQKWTKINIFKHESGSHILAIVHGGIKEAGTISISTCQACEKYHVWINGLMLVPDSLPIPLPSEDMPEKVKQIYLEARAVVDKSPKSAAALLRLGLQHLCILLGGEGKNINDDIAGFVKLGLDLRVQKALDIVRVTGNNAVHPGNFDLNDNPDIAVRLFSLLNFIVNNMITQPKLIDSFFEELPDGAKAAIGRRDR